MAGAQSMLYFVQFKTETVVIERREQSGTFIQRAVWPAWRVETCVRSAAQAAGRVDVFARADGRIRPGAPAAPGEPGPHRQGDGRVRCRVLAWQVRA